MSDELEDVALQAKDRGIGRATESRGTLDHDLHHRLQIGRRARENPQDLGCRRLLFERLTQGARELLI
jgi:hypothetical protein